MGETIGFIIPAFANRGIPKIEIPKLDSDFAGGDYGKAILLKYLPSILNKHHLNRKKIDYYHNYTLGLQDILAKKRLYTKDANNNNIIAENHAYRQVNFKVAGLCSDKREYAHKSDSSTNEIKYIDRYFTDTDFFAKDKNIKEWMYETGVGVSYQSPRTDIIVQEQVGDTVRYRYLTKDEGFDIENEAPFEFNDLDPRDNFVVYSSVRGSNPLFCVSLVKVEKDNIAGVPIDDIDFEYLLYIETRYARFIAKCDTSFTGFKELAFEMEKPYHYMPMIEQSYNNARMGIVELNRDLFNCINTLVSNVIDMVVDGANIILVFKNTDIDQKTIDEMKSKGALVLNDNPQSKTTSEAKLDVVAVKIDFNGMNSFYEERLSQCYDIAGVPLASGQVTSGGDTAQARMLGGGWENAYQMMKNDVTTILKSDYEVLRGLLDICKLVPNSPVKNISASEVDIKYHINQRDNLLTKAQSIAQLYQINMPKEEILKVTGLFGDVYQVSAKWEAEDEKAKAEAEADGKNTNNTDLVGGGDTGVARVT